MRSHKTLMAIIVSYLVMQGKILTKDNDDQKEKLKIWVFGPVVAKIWCFKSFAKSLPTFVCFFLVF